MNLMTDEVHDSEIRKAEAGDAGAYKYDCGQIARIFVLHKANPK